MQFGANDLDLKLTSIGPKKDMDNIFDLYQIASVGPMYFNNN